MVSAAFSSVKIIQTETDTKLCCNDINNAGCLSCSLGQPLVKLCLEIPGLQGCGHITLLSSAKNQEDGTLETREVLELQPKDLVVSLWLVLDSLGGDVKIFSLLDSELWILKRGVLLLKRGNEAFSSKQVLVRPFKWYNMVISSNSSCLIILQGHCKPYHSNQMRDPVPFEARFRLGNFDGDYNGLWITHSTSVENFLWESYERGLSRTPQHALSISNQIVLVGEKQYPIGKKNQEKAIGHTQDNFLSLEKEVLSSVAHEMVDDSLG